MMPRVPCGVAEVRAHRELAPAAERISGDRGDGHLRDVLHHVEDLLEALDHRTNLLRVHPGHHLHVGPRREDLLAAVDHDRADILPTARLQRDLVEVAGQILVDGVHRGTGQQDRAHAVLDLETHELAHDCLLSGLGGSS
jgi:hypothetical protein